MIWEQRAEAGVDAKHLQEALRAKSLDFLPSPLEPQQRLCARAGRDGSQFLREQISTRFCLIQQGASMPQAMRMARNANRHLVAAGFLASTTLFVLLMFVNWRDQWTSQARWVACSEVSHWRQLTRHPQVTSIRWSSVREQWKSSSRILSKRPKSCVASQRTFLVSP
jgi:hypothetical protein